MNKYNEQYRGESSDKQEKPAPTQSVKPANKMASPATKTKAEKVIPAMAGKSKWQQQVKAAKSQWGKLSEAEILNSNGDPQQLSTLVQQRYAITRDVADKQVHSFLNKGQQA